jgi:hypothetical protein
VGAEKEPAQNFQQTIKQKSVSSVSSASPEAAERLNHDVGWLQLKRHI